MSAGELTPGEVAELKRAIRDAEGSSGLKFSLFLGAAGEDAREHARGLHRALNDAEQSVLVLCDPVARSLEIVTGAEARHLLDDDQCALAAATMRSSFVNGNIRGGLEQGIRQLGNAARRPKTLHGYVED